MLPVLTGIEDEIPDSNHPEISAQVLAQATAAQYSCSSRSAHGDGNAAQLQIDGDQYIHSELGSSVTMLSLAIKLQIFFVEIFSFNHTNSRSTKYLYVLGALILFLCYRFSTLKNGFGYFTFGPQVTFTTFRLLT